MSKRAEQKATARERAARVRAEQARAERRRRMAFAGGAVAVVVLLVVGLVVAKLSGAGDTKPAASGTASTSLVQTLHSVPASVFDTVGTGTASNPPKAVKSAALTDSGKPRVLYVGGEFCPYCAAERWAIVVALERFGDFGTLRTTHSSAQDVFPSTATLSFHGSTYTSDVISFTGKEIYGPEQGTTLDSLSAADQKVTDTYSGGSIPFVDIAGKFTSSGATYDPGLLKGKTQKQIAAALKNPNDPITKAIVGSANVFTAAICDATGGKPGNVCSSSGVTKAAATLGKS